MQIIDTIIIQRMRMSLNDMQKSVVEASVSIVLIVIGCNKARIGGLWR